MLRGVDLEVASGEIIVIIGRSGGGKSVLLKHLVGLLRPDSGRIFVDGTDITRLRRSALDRIRERYGVVFQGGALFDSMSVFENVAFPLREKVRIPATEIRQRVEEKLAQVGLQGMGHKNPAEISGGMRKRVAIARALVTEPEVVFFDEPTTGLDPILVNTIHHLIVELHRKFRFTAVVVSHEIPEIFRIADRVAMLHEGVIVEMCHPGGHPGLRESGGAAVHPRRDRERANGSLRPRPRTGPRKRGRRCARGTARSNQGAPNETVDAGRGGGGIRAGGHPRAGLALHQARAGRALQRRRLHHHRGLPHRGRAEDGLHRGDRGGGDRARGRHHARRTTRRA